MLRILSCAYADSGRTPVEHEWNKSDHLDDDNNDGCHPEDNHFFPIMNLKESG